MFVAGTVAFVRFFWLSLPLRKERIGEPASRLHLWFPWLPGTITPAGQRIGRQMYGPLLIGWILLLVGWVLSGWLPR